MNATAVWLASFALAAASAWGANGDAAARSSELFGPDEPLAVRLEAPWGDLQRLAVSGRSRPGKLLFTSPAGQPVELDVEITLRGKSRLEVCSAPPLTLRLDPAQAEGTLFAADPVVHMTRACRFETRYLHALELEYLAYRLYALVADFAVGARRLSVRYLREDGKGRARARPAFIVEDLGLAARRAGREWVRPDSVPVEALDPEARAHFMLFQFLIGNTDWSVRAGPEDEPCCHNTALFAGGSAGLVPVPFDLDSSGLVDAPYASADSRLGLRSTRQRLWRGHCDLGRHLEAAIARFQAARPEIVALFADSEALAKRSKARAVEYVEEFFTIVGDPERVEKEIVGRCRGR